MPFCWFCHDAAHIYCRSEKHYWEQSHHFIQLSVVCVTYIHVSLKCCMHACMESVQYCTRNLYFFSDEERCQIYKYSGGTLWHFQFTAGVDLKYEQPRDKTNKMNVRIAKTQVSLGIQSLRCVLSGLLRTQAFFMRTAKTLISLGDGCPG